MGHTFQRLETIFETGRRFESKVFSTINWLMNNGSGPELYSAHHLRS